RTRLLVGCHHVCERLDSMPHIRRSRNTGMTESAVIPRMRHPSVFDKLRASTLWRVTAHDSIPHAVTLQISVAPAGGSHGGSGIRRRSANALTNGSYICPRGAPTLS